jgi:hypothetical protein
MLIFGFVSREILKALTNVSDEPTVFISYPEDECNRFFRNVS